MKSNLRHLPIVAAVMVAAACSSAPSWVVSEKKMSAIVADMEMVDVAIEDVTYGLNTDSLRSVARRSVLEKHGITPAEYDTSLVWYGHNLDAYARVYQGARETIEKRKEQSRESGVAPSAAHTGMAMVHEDGDSVEMWTSVGVRRLDGRFGNGIVSFQLPRDRNAEEGDIYELSFKLIGTTSPAEVQLAADYLGAGGTDYVTETTRGDGRQRVYIIMDSEKRPASVYGSISIDMDRRDQTVWVDSISLVRLRNKPGRRAPNPAQRYLK